MATDPAPEGRAEGSAAPVGVKPGRRRRWIVLLIRMPLLVYAGVVAIFFAFQARLIFPGSETRGKAESVVRPRPGSEL